MPVSREAAFNRGSEQIAVLEGSKAVPEKGLIFLKSDHLCAENNH
jgi:hypothetical protein